MINESIPLKVLTNDDLQRIQQRARSKVQKAKEELIWESLHPHHEKESSPSNTLRPPVIPSFGEKDNFLKALKQEHRLPNNPPLKKSSQAINPHAGLPSSTSHKNIVPSKSKNFHSFQCDHAELQRHINHLKKQIDRLIKHLSKKQHSRKCSRAKDPLKIERISTQKHAQGEFGTERQRFLQQALQHLTTTTKLFSHAPHQDDQQEFEPQKHLEEAKESKTNIKQVPHCPVHVTSTKINWRKSHRHFKHSKSFREKSKKSTPQQIGFSSIQGKEDDIADEYLDEILDDIITSLPENSHLQLSTVLFPSREKKELKNVAPYFNLEDDDKNTSFKTSSVSTRDVKESNVSRKSPNVPTALPLNPSHFPSLKKFILEQEDDSQLNTKEDNKGEQKPDLNFQDTARKSSSPVRLSLTPSLKKSTLEQSYESDTKRDNQKYTFKFKDASKESVAPPVILSIPPSQRTSILKQKDDYGLYAEEKVRYWRLTEEMADLILESTLHTIAHEIHTFSESLISKLYDQEFTPNPDGLFKRQ